MLTVFEISNFIITFVNTVNISDNFSINNRSFYQLLPIKKEVLARSSVFLNWEGIDRPI